MLLNSRGPILLKIDIGTRGVPGPGALGCAGGHARASLISGVEFQRMGDDESSTPGRASLTAADRLAADLPSCIARHRLEWVGSLGKRALKPVMGWEGGTNSRR